MTSALTPKGQSTRARMVEGAAEVLREQGVAFATLDDMRNRSGTSKSQLFRYFPPVEQPRLHGAPRRG